MIVKILLILFELSKFKWNVGLGYLSKNARLWKGGIVVEERRIKKHSVSLVDRENLFLTGILDVISFDEELVIAETEKGVILVRGEDLHVSRLSLENNELNIQGYVHSLSYEDEINYGKNKQNLLLKIFK